MDEERTTYHANGVAKGDANDSFNGDANGEYSAFDDDGVKVGDILERARKERGLSLQEVEQATKIRKRYLAGLEQEDYGVLPDSVYVQGFLKTYANYLGLDGEELSRDLKRRRGRRRDQRQVNHVGNKKNEFERPVLSPGGLSEARRSRVTPATLLTLLIAVVALGAVIGVLYYVGRDTQTVDPSQPSPQASPSSAEQEDPANDGQGAGEAPGSEGEEAQGDQTGSPDEGVEAGEPDEAQPPAETLAVTVSVEGTESWLSVSSDGAVVYAQVAQPGFSETFEAEEDITLSTGNAGAIEVEVNGQNIGTLGEYGQLVDRSFTLKDAG